MKNITIGTVGSDWRAAASARFYAGRGDGGEYAFGATPVEALEKLEKREAITANGLAEEIAFLALGAADAIREHRSESLDAFNGQLGLISEVIRLAPMVSERWRQIDLEQLSGVWLYDVTERFGRVWAENLLKNTGAAPAALLESIIADAPGKQP